MATPRADSYTGASGADLVVGRADVGTIVAGVWTPPRDGAGVIPLSTFTALRTGATKNQWVKVAGSVPNRILTQCQSKFGMDPSLPAWQLGDDHGGNAVFKPWCAPIVDYVNYKLYWYASGGHHNSSWNMIACFDFRTMQFDCLRPPSDPTDWSSEYKAAATFTPYRPAPPSGSVEEQYGAYQILPDGRPTSAHTYGDGVYDPVTNKLLRLLGRRWDYDLDTGAEQMFYYRQGSAYHPTYVNSWCFLHQASRRIWGHLPSSDIAYYDWHWMNADAPGSGNEITINNVGGWIQKTSNAACLMDADRVLHIGPGSGTVLRACIFNMAEAHAALQAGLTGTAVRDAAFHTLATGPGGVAEVTNGTKDNGDFPGLAYIPDWNQALIVKTADAATGLPSMKLLDIATQAELAYDRPGLPCPLTSGSYWGGNLGYLPGLKLAFHIDMNSPTQPSVYVMGVGPK